MEILELLAQRLQDKEIADHLGIATTTVKTHLRRLYQKLCVNSRRQAVSQARTLGLLTHC
jgi:LuxR family maltose regulon positive regulatory protein